MIQLTFTHQDSRRSPHCFSNPKQGKSDEMQVCVCVCVCVCAVEIERQCCCLLQEIHLIGSHVYAWLFMLAPYSGYSRCCLGNSTFQSYQMAAY
jgi:hypothetical protein